MATTTSISSPKSYNNGSISVTEAGKNSCNKLISENTNDTALEKAVVIDMFQYPVVKKSAHTKFTYTIKPGDVKRLSSNGVLTVFNLYEPIRIPVEQLLGKWKNSHVGVTLIFRDGKWDVDGQTFTRSFLKEETIVQLAFQRLLKFVKA